MIVPSLQCRVIPLYTCFCQIVMPKKKKQKKSTHGAALMKELYRHPYYFITLAGVLFLGAMAAFLLVLANVTTNQSQDIRQKAAGGANLPDLVISELSADSSPWNERASIHFTVKNSGTTTISRPFDVALTYGENLRSDADTFINGAAITIPVQAPMAAGEERPMEYEIAANTLSPGTYDILVSPDPLFLNVIEESDEANVGYRADGLTITGYDSTSSAGEMISNETMAKDNLYFTKDNTLEVFKENSSEALKISDITSGSRYTIRQTARIQNDYKNSASTDARSVTVQFRVNDSGLVTKNFALSELRKLNDGLDLVFETAFVGATNNTFTTTLDTDKTVEETNENDNILKTTYSYQVTTTTVSNATIASICNKGCANDGECGYGFTCWYNQCRHPDKVENENCAPGDSTVVGCDLSCQSNRDCVAGLTCTNNRCRNPQAINSTTCATTTSTSSGSTTITKKVAEKTTTTGQKGGTLTATPTPRTSPVKTPTPTLDPTLTATGSAQPIPTGLPELTEATEPTPDPEQTVLDDLLDWFQQLPGLVQGWLGIKTLDNDSDVADSPSVWFWVVIGVVLIAIIALVILLLSRRNTHSLPPVPPPVKHAPSPSGAVPMRSVQNPSPIHASVPGGVATTTVTAAPSLLVRPRPLPQTSPPVSSQHTSTQSTSAQSTSAQSTMISRLQNRGVIKPSSTTAPTTTPASTKPPAS